MAVVILFSGCAGKRTSGFDRLPTLNREFRGLWVATVSNLDWPSSRYLSVEQQKAEALALLDKACELNFNAIILQVRPAGDAFYRSSREPWSIFLTGTMGKDPGYDPLEFWVKEAHERGLLLHAWFNPYRVGVPGIKDADYCETSPVRALPGQVEKIGTKGYYWLNPGNPKSAEYVVEIVDDLLGYDIDGIVMDDYFYPYNAFYEGANPVYSSYSGVGGRDAAMDFPDEAEYSAALTSGFKGDLAQWRRQTIDSFVRRFYSHVKEKKRNVLVGISPFGIWRPGFPAVISGMDAVTEIYADSRKWLNMGWLDYFAPQLYWPIRQASQSYPVLLGWWKSENLKGRHLWPAINAVYASPSTMPTPESRAVEYSSQIFFQRGMNPQSSGFLMFRASALMATVQGQANRLYKDMYPNLSDSGETDGEPEYLRVIDLLQREFRDKTLQAKAVVPASPWLEKKPCPAPVVKYEISEDNITLSWARVQGAFKYAVYTHRKAYEAKSLISGESRIWWDQEILEGDALEKRMELIREGKGERDAVDMVIVSAVTRLGNESLKVVIEIVD